MGIFMLTSVAAAFGQGSMRRDGNLRVGHPAPDFTLNMLQKKDGKNQTLEDTVTLSSFFSRMPVVLIFGSYT